MLRLAVVRLQQGLRPSLSVARGFAAASGKAVNDAVATRRQQAVYYARINRKSVAQGGTLSMEALDRTARFLTSRGLSQTQAVRVIAKHALMTNYSPAMMQTKIDWLSELGLSDDKINDTIMRHPNILGSSFDKLNATVDWFLSVGVPQDKIAYVFNVFPQGTSCSIEDNLDLKVEFLRDVGCDRSQIARILTAAPMLLARSLERLDGNVAYLVDLGVPQEKVPETLAVVPQCLSLAPARIQETADAVDEMFEKGAGLRALVTNCRILMHNINQMRRSFNYLISVGFTKERLAQNTRFIMRNTSRLLRPRAQFLRANGVDVVANVSWISMADRRFIQKYPRYEAYLEEYKARLKRKQNTQ